MEELKNIDKIPITVQGLVTDFSKKVINTYDNEIKSIIAYGSTVSGDFNPKKSDVNLLLILNNTDLAQLKRCLPIVKKYRKKINPLILTKKYIQSSQDVYPMEFLEMKENYLTIYGEDVLVSINIDRQYLRLECEQQLKGILLKLKQGLFGKSYEVLLKESSSSVFTVFRNLIRIKAKETPKGRGEIIEKIAEYYKIDKQIFVTILRYITGEEKIRVSDLEIYFDKYLKGLETLTDTVNKS